MMLNLVSKCSVITPNSIINRSEHTLVEGETNINTLKSIILYTSTIQ